MNESATDFNFRLGPKRRTLLKLTLMNGHH